MSQAAILMTHEELHEIISEVTEKKIQAFKELFEKRQPEIKYESREQARTRLGISLPTLDELVRNGTIPAYRIGGRVLLIPSEVDAALHQIKSDKYYKR